MSLLRINSEFPECALGAVEGKAGPRISRQAGRAQPYAETGRYRLRMRNRVMQVHVEGIVDPRALAFRPDTRPYRSGNTKEHQCLVYQVRSQVPAHPPARTSNRTPPPTRSFSSPLRTVRKSPSQRRFW